MISGSFDSTGGQAKAVVKYSNISTGPSDPTEIVYDTITLYAGYFTSGDPGTFPAFELEATESDSSSGGGRITITLTNCTTTGDTSWSITHYQIT